MTQKLSIFHGKEIRKHFDRDSEQWYFSVIDVVAVLTDQHDYKKAKSYWTTLKNRLKDEGSEVVTKCNRLKMLAQDGKMRETDVANTESIFRLVQSIPSKKAEPFKLWLAKVGNERLEETADPEKAFDRAMKTYLQKGYSKQWINQRLKSIEVRKELTDEWRERDVKEGREFAILTDEITKAWSGLSVKDYKKHKNLKKEGLRDNIYPVRYLLPAL
ncbi:MAG: Bro-N domain-containing protein [Patescibacteria group bacterium]